LGIDERSLPIPAGKHNTLKRQDCNGEKSCNKGMQLAVVECSWGSARKTLLTRSTTYIPTCQVAVDIRYWFAGMAFLKAVATAMLWASVLQLMIPPAPVEQMGWCGS